MSCFSWIGWICFPAERVENKPATKVDILANRSEEETLLIPEIILHSAEGSAAKVDGREESSRERTQSGDDVSTSTKDQNLQISQPLPQELRTGEDIIQSVLSRHGIDLSHCVGGGVLDLGSLFEDDEADATLRAILPELCSVSDCTTLNAGGNTGLTECGWQMFGEKLLDRFSQSLQELYIQDCDLTVQKLGAVAPWIKTLRVVKSVNFGYNRDLDRDWINKILGVDFLERVEVSSKDVLFELDLLRPKTVERNVVRRSVAPTAVDLSDRIGEGVLDLGGLFDDVEADERLCEIMPELCEISGIATLNMGGNTGLTDVGWKIFGEKLLHRWAGSLEDIYFQDCDLTVGNLLAMAAWMKQLRAVKAIDLSCNANLDSDSLDEILGGEVAKCAVISASD